MTDIAGKPIVAGAQVEARWKKAAKFYSATIISVDAVNNTCHVKYHDGDSDPCVPGQNIRMPMSVQDYLHDTCVVKRKAFHQVPRADGKPGNYTLDEVRNLANEETKKVMDVWLKTVPDNPYPEKLSEFNYTYNKEGRLVNADTGEKFHWAGQRHYDALGDIIYRHIQEKMIKDYDMVEMLLPDDPKVHRAFKLNIFLTKNALTNPDRLLLLIQGSGAVRPGQWARALCINDSLDNGAIFKYLDKAKERGYGVIVFNPNAGLVEATLDQQMDQQAAIRKQYYDSLPSAAEKKSDAPASADSTSTSTTSASGTPEDASAASASAPAVSPTASEGKTQELKLSMGKKYFLAPDLTKEQIEAKKRATKFAVIPGHGDCEQHSCTVWAKVASKAVAKEIAIVAHSAGGYSTLALLSKHHQSLFPRLKSVAFTDAVHEVNRSTPVPVLDFLRKNAVNWVTARTPLDTPESSTRMSRASGCARVSAGHDTHEYTSAYAIDSVWRLIDSRSSYNPNNVTYDIPVPSKGAHGKGDVASPSCNQS